MQQTSFFRKLTTRPSVFLVLAGMLIAVAAAPLAVGAHHKPDHAGGPPGPPAISDALSIELDDLEVTDSDQGAGVFDGVLDITSFDVQDNQLIAVGNLTGTFTPDEGDPVQYDEPVEVPVNSGGQPGIAQQNGEESCPILFLELGPLFLDLLGLVVEIPDPIVLDVYALPGEGQLLGNLLCSIVGILDPATEDPVGTPLDQLLNNLNRLLERVLG